MMTKYLSFKPPEPFIKWGLVSVTCRFSWFNPLRRHRSSESLQTNVPQNILVHPVGLWTPSQTARVTRLCLSRFTTSPLFEISRGGCIFHNSLAAHHPHFLSYTCCSTCPAARSAVYASLWIMIDQMVGTSHSACAVAVTVAPLWHHCPLLWKALLRRGLHVFTWDGRSPNVSEVIFENTAGCMCACLRLCFGRCVAVFVCAWVFLSGLGQLASTALHHTTTRTNSSLRWGELTMVHDGNKTLPAISNLPEKCCFMTLISSSRFNLTNQNSRHRRTLKTPHWNSTNFQGF